MKTSDKKELQVKTENELRKELQDAKNSLASARLEHAQAKLKNTRSIFLTVKRIAVLKSIIRQKELMKNA